MWFPPHRTTAVFAPSDRRFKVVRCMMTNSYQQLFVLASPLFHNTYVHTHSYPCHMVVLYAYISLYMLCVLSGRTCWACVKPSHPSKGKKKHTHTHTYICICIFTYPAAHSIQFALINPHPSTVSTRISSLTSSTNHLISFNPCLDPSSISSLPKLTNTKTKPNLLFPQQQMEKKKSIMRLITLREAISP